MPRAVRAIPIARRESPGGETVIEEVPVYEQPTLIEVVSSAFDPARAGIGSSGARGDASSNFLPVPAPPSTLSNRYFFRVACLRLSRFQAARFCGFRQYVGLQADVSLSDDARRGLTVYPVTCEVRTPGWSFRDGNVTFSLRWASGPKSGLTTYDPAQGVNFDPNLFGTQSALLYAPGTGAVTPYTPPNAGLFPGEPVGGLGAIYDVREPWRPSGSLRQYDFSVEGPGDLILMASVKQTDPNARPVLPAQATPGVLSPEEQFLLAYPSARYGALGGAMLVEVAPVQARTQTRMLNR